MAGKVLVIYGSRYGATKEIAERIGKVLTEEGLQADVKDPRTVKDIGDYQGVIIGSAVYIGMWRKPVSNFVKKNEQGLSKLPVWIFSSGPGEKGDPVQQMKGWLYPTSLKQVIENIKPREITIFHGYINPQKMSWLERWMIRNVKSGIGDFRDWDMIENWAKKVAAELKK